MAMLAMAMMVMAMMVMGGTCNEGRFRNRNPGPEFPDSHRILLMPFILPAVICARQHLTRACFMALPKLPTAFNGIGAGQLAIPSVLLECTENRQGCYFSAAKTLLDFSWKGAQVPHDPLFDRKISCELHQSCDENRRCTDCMRNQRPAVRRSQVFPQIDGACATCADAQRARKSCPSHIYNLSLCLPAQLPGLFADRRRRVRMGVWDLLLKLATGSNSPFICPSVKILGVRNIQNHMRMGIK
uniref:Uncharacterized protein n=2 Tax=Physcomitrium patens TaxID=3218 RepID=A0A2K1IQL2_PHYPA|nr:hypothetical protein PHYPA_025690 [Physcomitrium patens]